MDKLYLIKNPELFQGIKKLKNYKNYFEGWYFKNTSNENSISFISGININSKKKYAFIQITLRKKEKIIFSDSSTNCGLEIVIK